MNKSKAILSAIAIMMSFGACGAQACGWNYPCNGHVYVTNMDNSVSPGTKPGFGDQGRAFAGVAGYGTSTGMKAYGVPAPLADAAGGKVQRDFEIAGRESTLGGAVLAAHTGVSIDSIHNEGIAGGRCSVVRNPLGNGC